MPPKTLEHELRRTFWDLRAALTQLLGALGAEAGNPRGLARRLGVNKNLAWKVSKIVQAESPRDCVQHLPGSGGLDIFLDAVAKQGAPADRIEAVRTAVEGFDQMVQSHCDDRATLELILDASSDDNGAPLERSRKLAFQGSSGIQGLQVQAMLTSFFFAPGKEDPALADQVVLGGLRQLRRLRGDATWPLVHRYDVNDDGTPIERADVQPLDGNDQSGVSLIREFCSGPVPEIRAVNGDRGTIYHLAEGPVGNAGAFSIMTGQVARGLSSLVRTDANRFLEVHAMMRMPVHTLQLDLFLHRDLDFLHEPELLVLGGLRSDSAELALREDAGIIPVAERIQRIGDGPPVVSTPLFDRYPELCDRVFERMGWSADEFVGRRVVMKYPPLPATVILRAPLPELAHESS